MAREYAAQGITFVFVYVREAHPGELIPAHRSFEQKVAQARLFQARFDVQRPILVDDLAGTAHQRYGMLPNMTYLIGRGGRVLFRSDWTDPPTIEVMLRYTLNARARRREGMKLAPFYADFVGYRWSDIAEHHRVLALGGQSALDDYDAMMKKRSGAPANPGAIDLGPPT